MIKNIVYLSCIIFSLTASAQQSTAKHSSSFELGSGLKFDFNQGAYCFTLGGMIQPSASFHQISDADVDYFFNAKRTYFNFSGRAIKEKVSFFIQTDFSLKDPLLDAWVAFHPLDNFNIIFGQKQTIGNNREMLVMETNLQFPGRSLLSTSMSNTGREFGLFIDHTLLVGNVVIVPQIAISSGDGRNSFGSDSRDIDLGGLKYAARMDFYPLGMFIEGNGDFIADLAHEQTLKLLVGASVNYNDGSSNVVGEGHGDFILYNALGRNQLPDYRQVYSDILMKYRGLSFLGEYGVSTATNLDGTFKDISGLNALMPLEISEFLALGSALNMQLGYVTRSGFGVDVRYALTDPEFDANDNSILTGLKAYTIALSKYFKNNNLKLQMAVSSMRGVSEAMPGAPDISGSNSVLGELVLQLAF